MILSLNRSTAETKTKQSKIKSKQQIEKKRDIEIIYCSQQFNKQTTNYKKYNYSTI